MANARVARGRETQVHAAEYLQKYWRDARSNPASLSGDDILDVPFSMEVKARREFRPVEWAKQARKREQLHRPTLVLMRPDGFGPAQIDDWLMFMRFVEGRELLHEAGY